MRTLKEMNEVVRHIKNPSRGFTVPDSLNGEAKNYVPDFIACIDDGLGPGDLLNPLIGVTGGNEKVAKVAAARALWIPPGNNHGGFD